MAIKHLILRCCLGLVVWSICILPALAGLADSIKLPNFFETIWSRDCNLKQAEVEAKQISDQRDKALAYLVLAEKYLEKNDSVKANTFLELSLTSLPTGNMEYGMAPRYARVYAGLKHYDKALALLPRARGQYERADSRFAVAEAYLNNEQLEKAFEILKSIPAGIVQKLGPDPVSLSLIKIADKSLESKNRTLAEKAIDSISSPYDRTIAFISLANLHKKQNEKTLAVKYLDRAFHEAKLVPKVLVPIRLQFSATNPDDRATTALFIKIADSYGAWQVDKAKASLEEALKTAIQELDNSDPKLSNRDVISTTIKNAGFVVNLAEKLGQQSFIQPLMGELTNKLVSKKTDWSALPKSASEEDKRKAIVRIIAQVDVVSDNVAGKFPPKISGLYSNTLNDLKIESRALQLLKSDKVESAFKVAQDIRSRFARSRCFLDIALECKRPDRVQIGLSALNNSVQAIPETSGDLSSYVQVLSWCDKPKRASRMLRLSKNYVGYYSALFAMADVYCKKGELDNSLQIVRAIPDGSLSYLGDPKSDAFLDIAKKAILVSKPDYAITATESLDNLFCRAEAYEDLAALLRKKGENDKVRSMLDRAVSNALSTKSWIAYDSHNDPHYRSKARLLGGLALKYKNIDIKKAKELWHKAMEIAQSGEEKSFSEVQGIKPEVEKRTTIKQLKLQGKEIGVAN